MHRRTASIALTALLLAGCGSAAENLAEEAAERAAEAAGGGDVEIDVDEGGGNVTIGNDEGSVSVGSGASLPEDFPQDMPLPPDVPLAAGSSFDQGEGERVIGAQYSMEGSSRDQQSELASYYESELPAAGWTVVSTNSVDGPGTLGTFYEVEKGDLSGSVVVSLLGPDEESPILQVAITLTRAG